MIGQSNYTANYTYKLGDQFSKQLDKINNSIANHKNLLNQTSGATKQYKKNTQQMAQASNEIVNLNGRVISSMNPMTLAITRAGESVKKLGQAGDELLPVYNEIKHGFIFPTIDGMSMFSDKQKQWTKETEHQVQRMAVSYIRAGMVVGKIGQIFTTAVTAPIVGAGIIGTKYLMQEQEFLAALEIHLRDKQKAVEWERKIAMFAAKTTATAGESRLAFMHILPHMKDMGIEGMMKQFEYLQDIAAGSIGANVKDLAIVVAKAASLGKVDQLVLKPFRTMGIPIMKYMAEAFNIEDITKIPEAIKKGEVTYKDLLKTLQYMGENIYKGADERKASTLAGRWSVFAEGIQMMTGSIVDTLYKTIKLDSIFKRVSDKVYSIVDQLKDGNSSISKFSLALIGAAAGFGPLMMASGTLLDMFGNLTLMAMGMRFAKKGSLLFGINKFLAGFGAIVMVIGKIGLLSGALWGLHYVVTKTINKPNQSFGDWLIIFGSAALSIKIISKLAGSLLVLVPILKNIFLYGQILQGMSWAGIFASFPIATITIITVAILGLVYALMKLAKWVETSPSKVAQGTRSMIGNTNIKDDYKDTKIGGASFLKDVSKGILFNPFKTQSMGNTFETHSPQMLSKKEEILKTGMMQGFLRNDNSQKETIVKIVVEDKNGKIKEVKQDGKSIGFEGWSNRGDYGFLQS